MLRARSRSKSRAPDIDHSQIEAFQPAAPKNSQRRLVEERRKFDNKRQQEPLQRRPSDHFTPRNLDPRIHQNGQVQARAAASVQGLASPRQSNDPRTSMGHLQGLASPRQSNDPRTPMGHLQGLASPRQLNDPRTSMGHLQGLASPRQSNDPRTLMGPLQGLASPRQLSDPRTPIGNQNQTNRPSMGLASSGQPSGQRTSMGNQNGQVQSFAQVTRRPSDPRTPMGNRNEQVQNGGQAMPFSGQTTYPRTPMGQRQNEHELSSRSFVQGMTLPRQLNGAATPLAHQHGQRHVQQNKSFGQTTSSSGRSIDSRNLLGQQHRNERVQGGGSFGHVMSSSSQRFRGEDPRSSMGQTTQRQVSNNGFQCGYSTGWASAPPTNRTPAAGQKMTTSSTLPRQTQQQRMSRLTLSGGQQTPAVHVEDDQQTDVLPPNFFQNDNDVDDEGAAADEDTSSNRHQLQQPELRRPVIESEDEEVDDAVYEQPPIKRERRSELLDNVPGPSFSPAAPMVANIAAATSGLGAVPAPTVAAPHWAEPQLALADDIQRHFAVLEIKQRKCEAFLRSFSSAVTHIEKVLRARRGGT